MNLLFFGSSGRQLFGAYHTPPVGVSSRGAALLCPPWGSEYLVSHRILRRLAARLSDSGYHVLRFDYYGTGDSAGERDEGDLTSWYADAALALDELRDMSGQTTVAVFGIRLGAVVAWRLALTRSDVRTLVMWDPVVNGADYVKELVLAQKETDRWSLSPIGMGTGSNGTLQLLGFPLTPAMRGSVEAITAAEFQQPTKVGVKLFYSDVLPGRAPLGAALEAGGTPFEVETVPGQTPWREDESMGPGGLPFLVLERMVALLR